METNKIAFEWKGTKIFLPTVVIHRNLRTLADDVYFGRTTSTTRIETVESEWNPSWSDDEDDAVQAGQFSEIQSECPKKSSSIRVNPVDRRGSEDGLQVKESTRSKLFLGKIKSKNEIFKNLTAQSTMCEDEQKVTTVGSSCPRSVMERDVKNITTNTQSSALDRNETNSSSNSNLKIHGTGDSSAHGENELRCKECGKHFIKKIHLVLHQKIHARMDKTFSINGAREDVSNNRKPDNSSSVKTNENAVDLMCKKCNRLFETSNQLKFHKKICKAQPQPILINGLISDVQQELTTTRNVDNFCNDATACSSVKFNCKDCGKQFKHRIQLNFHLRNHMKTCNRCGGKFRETELDDHFKICLPKKSAVLSSFQDEVRLKCITCGLSFSNQVRLSEHYLLHKFSIETFEDMDFDGVKYMLPYLCTTSDCESRFSDETDLELHLNMVHKKSMFSNTTSYYIKDNQLPPINPYVLLSSETRKQADKIIKTLNDSRKTLSPRRTVKKRLKYKHIRRQPRADIPYQDVYVCTTCERKFNKRNIYIIHINQHKNEEKYQCRTCDRKFGSEATFKAHMELHADDPTYVSPGRRLRLDIPIQSVYTCETCQKSFDKRNFYLSHLSAHKRELSCEFCERKFQSESLFQAHVNLHSDPNYVSHPGRRFRDDIPIQSVYTCETCDKRFTKRNYFLIHLAVHRREKFKCDLCERKFFTESLLAAHVQRHSDPSYVPGSRGRFRHDIPIQSVYTCDTCQKSFEQRNLFMIHIAQHKREEKFTCQICQRKCQSSLLFQLHMKRHSDPTFQPRLRNRNYTSIPVQDDYTCEKCYRYFTSRKHYIYHLYQHKKGKTGEPGTRKLRRSDIPIQDVYHCEICNNKPFTDRIKYIMHRNFHNRQEVKGPIKRRHGLGLDIPVQDVYYCELCGYRKSFTDRTKYYHHLRNHRLEKSHKCDGCLKLFKTSNARDLHSEKFCKRIPCKFKCGRCNDRFHNKITLARHFQRAHSRNLAAPEPEIEYPCNQCSQTFNTTFGLTRHRQIYHPVENVTVERETHVPQPGDSGDGENSSHSWGPDDDNPMLAASFCEAELTENNPTEDEANQNSNLNEVPKRKPPRGTTICQCGSARKYKSQKFCHSSRCPCIQAGKRCSENCFCDNSCLNSNEMEDEQQQKFKEGKECMMLPFQNGTTEHETNYSTPIIVGYSDEMIDGTYDSNNIEVEPEEPPTSSLKYSKMITTSEFITVDDGQDESMRQLSLEGYVEGADDNDPFADPLQEPEIELVEKSKSTPSVRNKLESTIRSMTVSASHQKSTSAAVLHSASSAVSAVHYKSITSSEDFNQSANLRCQFCKKNFKVFPTFISHILLHDLEKSLLDCPVCTKKFVEVVAYIEHLAGHNNGLDLHCAKCSSRFKVHKDMEKHLQVHHFRPMECGLCHIKFPNSQLMMNHWSKVHPTCQCGLCNVKFFSYDDLTFHMKSIHSPYDCLKCNERFEKLEELMKHFTQQHSSKSKLSQKMFTCTYCRKIFSDAEDFNEHLSNHLASHHTQFGEKSHPPNKLQCSYCNATFTTTEDLQDHLTHHLMNNSDLKNNSTEKLSFSFTQFDVEDETVNANIDAAELLSCPKCGKGFNNRPGWRSHLATHKLFLCSACDSTFDSREELVNHIYVTSCVVFFCDVCSRNFQAKRYLVQHKRLVHDGDKKQATSSKKDGERASISSVRGQAVTGRTLETRGNTQFVFGNSFPVIVASTSLAAQNNLPAQYTVHNNGSNSSVQTQEKAHREIEEIVLD